MKTLILNGSPRKAGDTATLLQVVRAGLPGEFLQIDSFDAKISPCLDCRYCRSNVGCCIKDDMQKVYAAIEESDRILIASPIWFGTLPGPLLSLASRLQAYFNAAFFRKEQPIAQSKKGAVILTGGGSGGAETAYETAAMLLRQMGAKEIFPPISSLQTDRIPALEDRAALAQAAKLAVFLGE